MKAVLACVACGEAHNVREARGASHRDLFEIRWEPRGLLGDESKKGKGDLNSSFRDHPGFLWRAGWRGTRKEAGDCQVVQAERMAVGAWEECWRNGGK